MPKKRILHFNLVSCIILKYETDLITSHDCVEDYLKEIAHMRMRNFLKLNCFEQDGTGLNLNNQGH